MTTATITISLYYYRCPSCGVEWENHDGRSQPCLNNDCGTYVEPWGSELVDA